MRALGVIMTAVAVLLSAPADGAAQTDLSGAWNLVVETPDQGAQSLIIRIAQDGQNLVATGDTGEVGDLEMEGMVDGSAVRFAWDLYVEGQELAIVFMGTIADDGTIAGTVDIGGFMQGGWTATRAEG